MMVVAAVGVALANKTIAGSWCKDYEWSCHIPNVCCDYQEIQNSRLKCYYKSKLKIATGIIILCDEILKRISSVEGNTIKIAKEIDDTNTAECVIASCCNEYLNAFIRVVWCRFDAGGLHVGTDTCQSTLYMSS